jgi:hypothetical protein
VAGGLEGATTVDITQGVAGPFATRLLSQMGAGEVGGRDRRARAGGRRAAPRARAADGGEVRLMSGAPVAGDAAADRTLALAEFVSGERRAAAARALGLWDSVEFLGGRNGERWR